MMLHKIQESQETITSEQNKTKRERNLLDSFGFLEHKSSASLSGCIDMDENRDYCEIKNNDKQNEILKDDNNNTYNDINNIKNNKQDKCNQRMLINIFGNFDQDNQNKDKNDSIYIDSPICNSVNNIDECVNESNCTTQNLFTSMTDRIPFNMFSKVQCKDKDEQNQINTNQNGYQQHQENKEFDIFSFVPLQMKPKKIVNQDDNQEDLFEIELFIKQQKLQQLNNVIEQAESIAVDLSDREDDFGSISSEQEKNQLYQSIPLILQPSFQVQNASIDLQLQNELKDFPFQLNDSIISLNFLDNEIQRCYSRNSICVDENQLPQIKRLCSEPLKVSMHKDKKKISCYSKKSSTPKTQKIQSKKLIQKLKSDKKQNKKQLNFAAHSS